MTNAAHTTLKAAGCLPAAEAAVPVYLGAGRWMRLLQDSLFDDVLASRGVQVTGAARTSASTRRACRSLLTANLCQ